MPNSVTGLVLLLVSLAPGYVYLLLAERQGAPLRTHSAFRETAQVILASVLALAATAALFGVARLICPGHIPSVAPLVRHPRSYWQDHFVGVTLWATGLLLLACFIAYLWGAHAIGRRIGEWTAGKPVVGLLWPESGTRFESAWTKLFEGLNEGSFRYVSCLLTDGSTAAGWLFSYNAQVTENTDRELVLSSPVIVTERGHVRVVEDGAVSLSARNIVRLEVTWHAETGISSGSDAGGPDKDAPVVHPGDGKASPEDTL